MQCNDANVVCDHGGCQSQGPFLCLPCLLPLCSLLLHGNDWFGADALSNEIGTVVVFRSGSTEQRRNTTSIDATSHPRRDQNSKVLLPAGTIVWNTFQQQRQKEGDEEEAQEVSRLV